MGRIQDRIEEITNSLHTIVEGDDVEFEPLDRDSNDWSDLSSMVELDDDYVTHLAMMPSMELSNLEDWLVDKGYLDKEPLEV